MIRDRLLPIVALALAGLSLGAGCPTIPTLKDRAVELAVSGSTSQTFDAVGVVNVYNQTESFDLGQKLNLRAILDDAGVDVEKVKNVKIWRVSYRVVTPDPNPSRAIQDGNVTVQRQGGTAGALVTDFNVNVSSVSGWQVATLDTAGVNRLNVLLEDILTSVKNNVPVPNGLVSCHASGVSVPVDAVTNFTWEIKLEVSIVGEVETKVLD
jgi:hypothetical protein